jgi:hypothetical protein
MIVENDSLNFPGLAAKPDAPENGRFKLWADATGNPLLIDSAGVVVPLWNGLVLKIDRDTVSGGIVDELTGETAVLPANCYIESIDLVRIEDFTSVTSFEVGRADETDWLIANVEHNLLADDPVLQRIVNQPVVLESTPILVNIDQTGNTTGEARVFVRYRKW